MDEDKAFEELNRKELEKLDFGAEAEAFILNAKKRHIVVTFSGTEIKVKPAVPRETGLKIGKLEARTIKQVKKYEGVKEEDITEEMVDEMGTFNEIDSIAEILSSLCLEYPFNNPKFWIQFEQQTEQLSQVYAVILTEIYNSEKKITEFRKD